MTKPRSGFDFICRIRTDVKESASRWLASEFDGKPEARATLATNAWVEAGGKNDEAPMTNGAL